MDIRKFAVEQTGRLHLRDASEELMYADAAKQLPMAVILSGPGSKQYSRAQAAQHNRMIDKLKRKGKTSSTAEQNVAETAEFLADCTIAFENVEYEGTEGRDLAIAVYSDTEIGFIADQVAKHLGDWSNFTTPSTTNL